jgi:hypothetical protein
MQQFAAERMVLSVALKKTKQTKNKKHESKPTSHQ